MIITAWGISSRIVGFLSFAVSNNLCLASASSHFEAVILIIDITFYVGDLLIFLRAWYILSLLGFDIKLKGKYFHGNVRLCSIKSCFFSRFFHPGGKKAQYKLTLLVKRHFLKSSKKWKHLHKCCFHGHLSCFCLAPNEKNNVGFLTWAKD